MVEKRVMVVDDDVVIRTVLCELLAEDGYGAIGARDGAEALDMLRKLTARPDVIVLDVKMPRMDGLAFRRAQLEEPRIAKIPVIALTASTKDAKALGAGVEVMEKPVAVRRLFDAIKRIAPTASS